jgi:hypothetical protein
MQGGCSEAALCIHLNWLRSWLASPGVTNRRFKPGPYKIVGGRVMLTLSTWSQVPFARFRNLSINRCHRR